MLFWEHLKCSPASNTARWPRVKPRFMSSPWYLLHLWQYKRAPICISSADKVRAVHTQLFPCYSWPLCWTITLFSRCIGFAHSPFWSSLSWLVAVSLSYTTPESIPPFFSGRYDLKIYIFWPHSYYSWLSVRKQKLKWKQPMLSSVADLSLSLFPDITKIYFVFPTHVSYTSILHIPSTAAWLTNTLSIPSITLIQSPANKSLLPTGAALISALLSRTQAKLPSHRPSLLRRDIILQQQLDMKPTWTLGKSLLRPAQSC